MGTYAQARAARGLLSLYTLAAAALASRGLGLLAWQHRGLAEVAPAAWSAALAATLVALALALAACVRVLRRRVELAPSPDALALRAIFVVLAGALAAAWWCAQPYVRVWAEIGTGAVCGIACASVFAAPRLLARVQRGFGRVVDVLLFDLAVVLVLGELGLGVLARVTHWEVLAQPRRHAAQFLEQNRPAPGTPHLGFRTNSGGHYDTEFGPRTPGRLRVVCVGDSFSASTVPHLFHYTTVAEELLGGAEVLNLGVGGIGPPEYALLVGGEGRALDPDVFVVALFVGNDVFFYDRGENAYAAGLRAWLDADQVFVRTLPARWRALARERERGGAAGPTGTEVVLESRADVLAAFPWLADTSLEQPGFSPEAFVHDQLVHAQGICTGSEASYGPFFAALEHIVALAGDRPLGFLVIPEEFQLEDDVWREIERGVGDGAERDRPQRLVTAWCTRRGVACEDLLPRLRALPAQPDGRRHAYIVRNTHFNALGNRVAAEGLAALVARLRAGR